MTLFVDTSVWSLALRRDQGVQPREVSVLLSALQAGEPIVVTGLILQELLQGFNGPRARDQIVERFSSLPLLAPEREDYVDAAGLRNRCRRRGVQVGTVDALLAQLCVRHDLTMLTTDRDFASIARHTDLKLWRAN